jgi:arylsulfatase A-like enzyme
MSAMTSLVRVVALSLVLAASAGAGPRPHVYLVVIDGLGADALDAAVMPRLAAAATEAGALRTEARAVMPTRTNPNHVTLLTGLFPESHGITGNGFWDRAAGAPKALDAAGLIDAETLFTVAETTRPALRTVAAFSKAKLGGLFAAVPGRQRAPDVLWIPETAVTGHLAGLATDAETMDAFLAATARVEPDLAAINLSGVDRASHEQGPRASTTARADADREIGRLIDDLRARDRWHHAVVIVTADHGFDDVAPSAERPRPAVDLAATFAAAGVTGIHVVSDGGVAHVYADTVAADATSAGAAAPLLGWAAAAAWREPSVAEVLARLPVAGVETLADRHPDWALAHERTGELLVVANPGYAFVDATDTHSGKFLGNHGSPREMRVPLIVTGGAIAEAPRPDVPPSAADVGATIAALLGLPPPKRFAGTPLRLGRAIPLGLRDAPSR